MLGTPEAEATPPCGVARLPSMDPLGDGYFDLWTTDLFGYFPLEGVGFQSQHAYDASGEQADTAEEFTTHG